jgi:hypothetical protein
MGLQLPLGHCLLEGSTNLYNSGSYRTHLRWRTICFVEMSGLAIQDGNSGEHVRELNAAATGQIKPRAFVSVLVAVFIVAWGMLTVLVVLQDRMIDAQSSLIHTLFARNAVGSEVRSIAQRNGKPLAARPAKKASAASNANSSGNQSDSAIQSFPAGTPSVQVPRSQAPLSQVPLSEDSSSQAPLSQAPSSQVKPKSGDKTGRSSRKMRSPFSRPPAEITDPSDRRRVSISI